MLLTITIDDEIPALQLMSNFIKRVPFLELRGAFSNAFDALDVLQQESIDLLFLDIEMPDITGIEFLKSLERKPMVIFTTAYDQYALKGYELDVLDYLLKPIPFPRFLKACNKALTHSQATTNKQLASSPSKEYLFVKADYQTVKITIADILYIEGLKDYAKIFTKKGMVLTRQTLKSLERQLPAKAFIRIHRSYIAAFRHIDAFQKSQILIGKTKLPIGESYKNKLLKWLG